MSHHLSPHHAKQLDRLRVRFAAFREANPPRTRIPAELRRAVITAIDDGLPPSVLARACGLSANQVQCWRNASTSARLPASILTVIDEQRAAAVSRDAEIHLCIAGWSVRLRFEPPPAERS
jgi:hypothetical protein